MQSDVDQADLDTYAHWLHENLAEAQEAIRLAALSPNSLGRVLFYYLWGTPTDDVVRFLVDLGADVNLRVFTNECPSFSDGGTPLTWASTVEQVRVMVEAGARVDEERPKNRMTSVHEAAEIGDVERLRLLVEQAGGAFAFDKLDDMARTPLACAAQEGRFEAVCYLLAQGCDPNFMAENSYTVLERAVSGDHIETARLLLEAGADPDLYMGLNSSGRERAQQLCGRCLELFSACPPSRQRNAKSEGDTG